MSRRRTVCDFSSRPVPHALIEDCLRAAGSDLPDVIKTTVYVSDIALWGRVNAVYASVFGAATLLPWIFVLCVHVAPESRASA